MKKNTTDKKSSGKPAKGASAPAKKAAASSNKPAPKPVKKVKEEKEVDEFEEFRIDDEDMDAGEHDAHHNYDEDDDY